MKIGEMCSYYNEGWRCGRIRSQPIKGRHKFWIQIESTVQRYTFDRANGKWVPKPAERVWVHQNDVNPLGDTQYHGPKLVEVVAERKERKATQQAKAVRRAKRL